MVPVSNAMSRLVLEHLAERNDYRGDGAICKERGVKHEKLADFRWVFPMRAVESRTRSATFGWGQATNKKVVARCEAIGKHLFGRVDTLPMKQPKRSTS